MSQQVKITVPQMLGYLEQGMKREDIAKELGLSMSDVKRIFEHPELKGKQARKTPGFVFVDENTTTENFENTNQDDTYTGDATEEISEDAETVTI